MTPEVGDRYLTKYDPFTVTRYNDEKDWAVRWDDGLTIESPAHDGIGGTESFAVYCEEFEAVPA